MVSRSLKPYSLTQALLTHSCLTHLLVPYPLTRALPTHSCLTHSLMPYSLTRALLTHSYLTIPTCRQWFSDETTEGAECSATVIAASEIFFSSFNIDIFENLFGPVDEVLRRTQVIDSEPRSPSMRRVTSARLPPTAELKFDSTRYSRNYLLTHTRTHVIPILFRFKMKCVYGSGSFGVVIAAEYKDFNNDITQYALKVLTKVSVIETGQLRHVLDERKLLSIMNSRFVLITPLLPSRPH